MRITAGIIALCAALLLAWPGLATEDEKGKGGDTEVGAVIEEGQPPAAVTPPVEGAPPGDEAKPSEPDEGGK